MAIKTVLFDLDDTLFDHAYSSRCGLAAVQPNYACFNQTTLDDFERETGVHFDALWPEVMRTEISLEGWLLDSFRRIFVHYGELPDEALCMDVAKGYRDAYRQSWQPIKGAIPLLEALKPRVKIGIITNHLSIEQREKLHFCKFESLIDFMVCVDEAGMSKPDPKIFELALQHAECRPDEAVMVGDSWSSDVKGANAAGIRAVWFNRSGLPIPDISLAMEITSLEPTEDVVEILLNS